MDEYFGDNDEIFDDEDDFNSQFGDIDDDREDVEFNMDDSLDNDCDGEEIKNDKNKKAKVNDLPKSVKKEMKIKEKKKNKC